MFFMTKRYACPQRSDIDTNLMQGLYSCARIVTSGCLDLKITHGTYTLEQVYIY